MTGIESNQLLGERFEPFELKKISTAAAFLKLPE